MNTLNQISDAAMKLPEAERLALAETLFHSVDAPDYSSEARDQWLAEIRRRRDAYLRGESKTFSVDETMEAARKHLEDVTGASR